MARAEFSKVTKREGKARANGRCEAFGTMYGMLPGRRCNMPLNNGIEYDHIILDANSHDNSLTNCAACCPSCHHWKSAHYDTPLAAKTLRQQDKDNSIRARKGPPMPGSRLSKFKRTMDGRTVLR